MKRQSESRPVRAARSKETFTPTLLALLAASITLVLMVQGYLDAGELYSFNLRCQWRPQRVPTDNVFLLVIDEGTVQSDILGFGTFPWARSIWANLQSGLIDPLEPNSIVYDIIFDQPGPVEGADERFAEAIEKSGNVLLAFSLLKLSARPVSATESREYNTLWYPPSRSFERRFALDRERVEPGSYLYGTSALRPLQDFERVARLLGHTTTPPDSADGTTRRFPLVMGYAGNYYPSLPLASACHYLGVDLKDLRVLPGDAVEMWKDEKLLLSIPIDRNGNLLLNYYGPDLTVFPSMSIKDFLKEFDPQTGKPYPGSPVGRIRDRILIVGSTALSTHDLRPVTVNDLYPLVGNIATAIANIIGQDFMYQTNLPTNVALLFLISVLFAGLAQSSQHLLRPLLLQLPSGSLGLGLQLLVQLVPALVVAAVYGWFSYDLLARHAVVIPMFQGLVSLALTYLIMTLYNFITEEQSRRWFEQTWGRYMSPEMIVELRDNPEQLNLGGEVREITILFSDICGFTSLSEQLQPTEVVHILNEYFDAMVSVVDEYRGMLDKYIGDAIMVHFGSPRKAPDDALRAVQTGLEMQRRLAALSEKWAAGGRGRMQMRVGINTGSVVVGNIGSARRHEYTAIGDNVNIAQRLESNCPRGGVLISKSTYELVKEQVEVKALEPLKVKGRQEAVEVYLVVKLKD